MNGFNQSVKQSSEIKDYLTVYNLQSKLNPNNLDENSKMIQAKNIYMQNNKQNMSSGKVTVHLK